MPHTNRLSTYRTTIGTDAAGTTHVTYVRTAIVSFDAETVTLDSGGWQTVTTKRKMNQAACQFGLGYGVFQRKGEWFVSHNGETVPFRDGMTLARNATRPAIAA